MTIGCKISNVILDESLGITIGKELSKDGDKKIKELLFTKYLIDLRLIALYCILISSLISIQSVKEGILRLCILHIKRYYRWNIWK